MAVQLIMPSVIERTTQVWSIDRRRTVFPSPLSFDQQRIARAGFRHRCSMTFPNVDHATPKGRHLEAFLAEASEPEATIFVPDIRFIDPESDDTSYKDYISNGSPLTDASPWEAAAEAANLVVDDGWLRVEKPTTITSAGVRQQATSATSTSHFFRLRFAWRATKLTADSFLYKVGTTAGASDHLSPVTVDTSSDLVGVAESSFQLTAGLTVWVQMYHANTAVDGDTFSISNVSLTRHGNVDGQVAQGGRVVRLDQTGATEVRMARRAKLIEFPSAGLYKIVEMAKRAVDSTGVEVMIAPPLRKVLPDNDPAIVIRPTAKMFVNPASFSADSTIGAINNYELDLIEDTNA